MTNLSDIFLRTSINGTTQNLSISGVGNIWDGSGTPWNDEHTTPFELAMNDRTGQRWTPKATTPALLLSGGDLPHLLDRSAAPVSETLPIQIRADSYDHAVMLKHTLQRFLINQQFEAPVTLWVRPYGASSYAVFEVLDGVVQEQPPFINEEAGSGFLRVQVTITRQGYGTGDYEEGVFSSNPQTVGNSPLVTPDGLTPFSATITGDCAYAGEPMNLQIVPLSTATIGRMWLATVVDGTHPSSTDTTTYSTSSTSGITPKNVNASATPAMNAPVKPRVMLRVASATTNAEFRIVVSSGSSTGTAQTTLYTSAWQAPPAGTSLMDMGTWPMDLYRKARAPAPYITIAIQLRSTNGASASTQISWLDLIWYYEFCRIDGSASVDYYIRVSQYIDANAYHPTLVAPIATLYDRNNFTPVGFADVRGTLPRYHAIDSPGGLWAMWYDVSGTHSTTAQVTIQANKLPLFYSLRGA